MLDNFAGDKTYTGLHYSSFNLNAGIQDFLRNDYVDGLTNEFNTMDALINSLPKQPLTAKKRYKTFALGIVDNVRSLGSNSMDLYKIEATDFIKGAETVDCEFDTTKMLGVFSITDEVLLRGTGDGTVFDILGDTLSRMEMGLKNTMNRFTYGSHTGKLGVILRTGIKAILADDAENGYAHDKTHTGAAPGVQSGTKVVRARLSVKMTNSYSLLPGMEVTIIKGKWVDGAFVPTPTVADQTTAERGNYKIWQKVNDRVGAAHERLIIVPIGETTVSPAINAALNGGTITSLADGEDYHVFSRQIRDTGAIAAEYHGLEDIIMTKDNKLFGVDRKYYPALNCIIEDMSVGGVNQLLTEGKLRDMADEIDLSSPEGAKINLVISKHSIISAIEKQFYTFKNYSMDTAANGFKLGGRSEITFDDFVLRKDKYSRDNNVYMIDTGKIGELVRKEFDWITQGRENILERLPGTEVYEGIMTKYADMYIDSWKGHAAFKNVADSVDNTNIYPSVNINNTGALATALESLGEE